MAGHRNPNQKIQLHLKIKEENNRLKEDNFRLQEDLQKKIEYIQKNVGNNSNANNAISPALKKSKDLETLLIHIMNCP
jgi:hypothetical protein